MYTFTVLLVLAATTFTSGVANPSQPIHELIARQSFLDPSIIPEQCRDKCTPLLNALNNNCTAIDCICGSTVANNMIDCLQCDVPIVGAQTAQNAYKGYADSCKSTGKDVPDFTASSSSSSKNNGASRMYLAGASLAGVVGLGLFLAA